MIANDATDSAVIRPDGSIEGTDKIQLYEGVYSLKDDFEGTVVVEKDNIVIDCENNSLIGFGSDVGITLSNRNNVTIKNMHITNFNQAIELFKSSNNTVENCHLDSGCIVLRGSENNCIIYNEILSDGNGIGIWFDVTFDNPDSYSKNNVIFGNNITNQGVGINNLDSSSNIISGNRIENCSTYGIYLENSPNNTITGNNLENNAVAIFFSASSDNTLYHNNLIDNQKDVDDSHSLAPWLYGYSVNLWSDGSSGNYWSSYTAKDLNGDNIGDSVLIINENNTDNFPLMNPIKTQSFPLPKQQNNQSPDNESPTTLPLEEQPSPNVFITVVAVTIPIALITALLYITKQRQKQKTKKI